MMLTDSATDHATLAAQLERNGHDDAAKAIRELLVQVQKRDRRIEALEHCIVALGGELQAHKGVLPSKGAVIGVLKKCYDEEETAAHLLEMWRGQ